MRSPAVETLPLGEWQASVSRTPAELRYTIRPPSSGSGGLVGALPVFGLFAVVPAVVLFRVGNILAAEPTEPPWAVALTWLYATLLAAHLLLAFVGLRYLWGWHRHRQGIVVTQDHVASFTGTEDRVLCPAADVREVRVYVYPDTSPDSDSEPRSWADIELVVGEQRQTFSWLVGFPAADTRTLAADLHQRLNDFRSESGLSPLGPLAVVETTGAVADAHRADNPLTLTEHTAAAFVRACLRAGLVGFARYPWVTTIWGAAGIAGAVGAHRLLSDGAGSSTIKFGGFVFFLLVLVAWQYDLRERAAKRALAEPSPAPPRQPPGSDS